MMLKAKRRRVLAMEVRSKKIGYAVFEGGETLLDWGIRWFAKDNAPDLSHKLTNLLQMSRPTLILISGIRTKDHRNGHLLKFPVDEIKRQAVLRSIPVKSLSKTYLRVHFKHHGHWNKHEVAQAIARRFPELAWHLPKRRRAWDSEAPNQVVFDAVALGLRYFAAPKLRRWNAGREGTLWSAPDDE